MDLGNRQVFWPHVDGRMSFQAKGGLQRLDRTKQSHSLRSGEHAAIVSALTVNVNRLTADDCKVADMRKLTFPERAKAARKRVGLIPQAAADEIGCSRPTILRWEKDADSAGAEYLMKAAKVYKVRPQWLAMQSQDDGYPWEGDAEQAEAPASQPLTRKHLIIAAQLVAQAYAEKRQKLPPPHAFAEILTTCYEMLDEGLPEAKVLRFVRTLVA